MMGRQRRDQSRLFYEFRLEDRIPKNHLLRRMNVFVTVALADLHKELKPHYSDIGRPSIDPELMIRMLIVGYCYGIRSERKLCDEVELSCTWRTAGSASSIWRTRFHTTRRSPRTVLAGFARATSSVTSSSAWCGQRWRGDWSRARASPSMPALWRPMPVAITAWRPVRSAGLTGKSRSARSPSISMHSMLKPRDRRKPRTTTIAARMRAEPTRASLACRLSASHHTARRRSDLTVRSGLRLDRQGQQARAVRLRPQLSDRRRACCDSRCRGYARTYLRRGRRDAYDDRPHRTDVRSQAEAADCRHSLRYRPLPRLAGEEDDHAAHTGVGHEQTQGRRLFALRLHLRQAAQPLYMPGRQDTDDDGPRRSRQRYPISRRSARLSRVPTEAQLLPGHGSTTHCARPRRGCPRRGAAQDEDQGVSQVARPEEKGRDALCTPEDPSPLRAHAPARPIRCPRRVPPRRDRPEPQDASPAPHPAATTAHPRVSCVHQLVA